VSIHRTSDQVDVEAPAQGEIAAAEARVARAGAAFSTSLRNASLTGAASARRLASVARPVLIGVGVLAAVVVVARLLPWPRVTPAPRRAPPARSLWSDLARTTALSLAAVAGRHLAQRWLGPSAGRAMRRLSGALLAAALLTFAPVTSEQYKLSLEGDVAFPSSSSDETGWGAGARFGYTA